MAEQIGEVTILNGSATAQGPDGVRELAMGSPIYNDDVVSTGARSALEIEFSDGALLSQGASSKVHLDEYVFDPENDAGEMTMNLIEGTFRSVTGQIVDMNPEGFKIDTPNTTIGIRGTTTGHTVNPDGTEIHAVVDFVDKPVVFTSRIDGTTQIISRDGFKVISTAQGMSGVERATASDLATFERLSTRSMERDTPRNNERDNNDQGDGEDASGGGSGGEVQGEQDDVHGGEYDLTPEGIMEPESIIEKGVDEMLVALPDEELEKEEEKEEEDDDSWETKEEEPEEEEETPEEEAGLQTNATLDLHDFGDDLTVYLADPTGSYYPTATPGDAKAVDPAILNVIGDVSHENKIYGNDGNNELWGGSGDDTLEGDHGNDTIYGSGGSDNLQGDNGFDYVSYADQGDRIYLCLDSNSVTKDAGGSDTIGGFEGVYGTNYNDDIYADNNANVVYGNDGNDVIWGHGGADTLYGGAGDDKFKFETHDPAAGTQLFGGDGTDALWIKSTIDLSGLQTVDSVEKMIFGGSNCTVTFKAESFPFSSSGQFVGNGGSTDTVILNATSSSGGTYNLSSVSLTSWEAADKIVFNGTGSRDLVYGSSGTDSIVGNGGNDYLNGGNGNDILSGGAGTDVLFGGQGGDDLTGGTDSDIFQYTATNQGGDTITDFDHTDDSFLFRSADFGGYTGTLDSGHFFATLGAMTGTDAAFYMDSNTLFYDEDGVGTDSAVAIADVGGATIDNTDIIFV